MDRVGRMPVIRGGFVGGAIGCAVVAGGCALSSATLVALGLAFLGASGAVDPALARRRRGDVPAERHRARGMSFVLFGAVSGAIWGPLLFGPLFAHRAPTAHGLVAPWLLGIPFMVAGYFIAGSRPPGPEGDLAQLPERARRLGSAGAAEQILRRAGRASRRWSPPSRASP